MQLRAEQRQGLRARGLAPVSAAHADEPLLALEAADAVRAAARRQGFSERVVLEPGRGFDWSEFTHAAASLSLFAEKKLVELRLAAGKPGLQGAEAIAAHCGRPGADIMLLVSVPRLDRSTQNAAWFRALAEAGVIIDVYPVDRPRLPAWIAERLARSRQSAPREVLEFLADRVEGNLLAAYQEVQKLALLAPEGELSIQTVNEAVASVARYDPYVAAGALLAHHPAPYVRVIEGLRAEGEQPTFVLFVLSSVLFVLHGLARGERADPLFVQHRLFNKPLQRAVQAAARRYPAPLLASAIAQAAAIDRAIKGVGSGAPCRARAGPRRRRCEESRSRGHG